MKRQENRSGKDEEQVGGSVDEIELRELGEALQKNRKAPGHDSINTDLPKSTPAEMKLNNWLSKDYVSVDREQLREYVKARLKVFYEEELDVALVLFDEVIDHLLRIDRIFRQPQGHLLLIGVSGAGKTTLSRFVAWMNGLLIFQIKTVVNAEYFKSVYIKSQNRHLPAFQDMTSLTVTFASTTSEEVDS
ncbi:hypothetical protein Trydic_g3572 [Trypoxylus dichotomus]